MPSFKSIGLREHTNKFVWYSIFGLYTVLETFSQPTGPCAKPWTASRHHTGLLQFLFIFGEVLPLKILVKNKQNLRSYIEWQNYTFFDIFWLSGQRLPGLMNIFRHVHQYGSYLWVWTRTVTSRMLYELFWKKPQNYIFLSFYYDYTAILVVAHCPIILSR